MWCFRRTSVALTIESLRIRGRCVFIALLHRDVPRNIIYILSFCVFKLGLLVSIERKSEKRLFLEFFYQHIDRDGIIVHHLGLFLQVQYGVTVRNGVKVYYLQKNLIWVIFKRIFFPQNSDTSAIRWFFPDRLTTHLLLAKNKHDKNVLCLSKFLLRTPQLTSSRAF